MEPTQLIDAEQNSGTERVLQLSYCNAEIVLDPIVGISASERHEPLYQRRCPVGQAAAEAILMGRSSGLSRLDTLRGAADLRPTGAA